MSIEVGAEVVVDLHEKTKQVHHRVMHGGDKPVRKPVGGSLVIPVGFSGSGPVLLAMQSSPAHGRSWNILKIGVFGADVHTAVASVNADVYAGDVVDYPIVNTNFNDAILSNLTVPSITQFGRRVEWAYSGQSVYALLYGSGLAAGQSYVLVARVAEYNTNDVEADRVP